MTKKALYIFNPEHDLALASGETNYMAPASARQMASELALLPMWYAEEGSVVLAPSAYNLDYVKKIQELSLIHISEPTRQAEISYAVFCLKKKKQQDISPSKK